MTITTTEILARVRKIKHTGLGWKGDTDLLRDIMVGQLKKLEQEVEEAQRSRSLASDDLVHGRDSTPTMGGGARPDVVSGGARDGVHIPAAALALGVGGGQGPVSRESRVGETTLLVSPPTKTPSQVTPDTAKVSE